MYKDTYVAAYFGTEIIDATKELMTKIWGAENSKRDRINGINVWLDKMCTRVGIDRSKVVFSFIEGNDGLALYKETGGGQTFFDQATGVVKIYLYRKFSFTTVAHEFRHAMQYLVPEVISTDGLMRNRDYVELTEEELENGVIAFAQRIPFDAEEDAREFSCSLYYIADPDRFMRALSNHKLIYA